MQLTSSPSLTRTEFWGFLAENQLADLVQVVEDHYTPCGPVRKGRVWSFAKLESPEELDLTYTTTVLPPKHLFQPPSESILEYVDGRLVEPTPPVRSKPLALIGIHPCDLHGLRILDEVYETQGQDPHYTQHREGALLIVRTCDEPRPSCFCNLTGTGPHIDEGFDIRLVPTEGGYLVSAGSAAGSAVLAQLSPLPPTDDLVQAAQSRANQAVVTLERQNRPAAQPTISSAEAETFLAHPEWEDLSRRCMGCGACTTVCPTCFCYDVIDEASLDGSRVHRFRRWDSCLYLRYHELAGQPNELELESRLRQRLYHKWIFHEEQFGEPGCVGCGRCIDACAARIDPREILCSFRRDTDDVV